MERTIAPTAAEKLDRRAPLPVDAHRSIAIKRDVHELIVEAPADRFAEAFRQVMIDPRGSFGLIRVKRPEARMGRDFAVGERFQGCYSIEAALLAACSRGWRRRLRPAMAALLASPPVGALVTQLEDALLSDYAQIEDLVLAPAPGEAYVLKYAYLDGTPIAGSSTFTIEALGPARCRVRQIFEYQEVNGLALATFQRFGLKMHDQVVYMQIAKAADRVGAPPPAGTIPLAYAHA